jgi:hypothetical protein
MTPAELLRVYVELPGEEAKLLSRLSRASGS